MGTATALKLQDAGFNRQQIDALVDLVERETVTKADLVAAEAHLENKIDRLIGEIRAELAALRAELKGPIKVAHWMAGASITVSLATLAVTISIAIKVFS